MIVKKRERAVDLSLDFLLACLPLVDASATATTATVGAEPTLPESRAVES